MCTRTFPYGPLPVRAVGLGRDVVFAACAASLVACATAPPIPTHPSGQGSGAALATTADGFQRPAPEPEPLIKLTRPGPPNVLFILIDTTRADRTSFGGYHKDTTPNLARLADRSVVFEQARATGPATRFTVPCILTGKHFTEIHRGGGKWAQVPPTQVMLHTRLKEVGYFTGAVHSIRYFRRRYGFKQTADLWDTECVEPPEDPALHKQWRAHSGRRARFECAWHRPTAEYITDKTLWHVDRLELPERTKPWFLWAYYSDPHAPYTRAPGVPSFGTTWPARYDREIAYADKHVGRLLDGLRERGMLENTVIVVTSDHGEALDSEADHGHLLHSANLYDELVRVPLIVYAPGVPARRVQMPVSVLDIHPTLLEMANIPRPDYLRGVSLLPWLAGERRDRGPIFFEKHRREDAPMKAMLDWPYKVIVTMRYRPGDGWTRYGRLKIFDVEQDPKELRRINRTVDPVVKEGLMKTFDEWLYKTLEPAPRNPVN